MKALALWYLHIRKPSTWFQLNAYMAVVWTIIWASAIEVLPTMLPSAAFIYPSSPRVCLCFMAAILMHPWSHVSMSFKSKWRWQQVSVESGFILSVGWQLSEQRWAGGGGAFITNNKDGPWCFPEDTMPAGEAAWIFYSVHATYYNIRDSLSHCGVHLYRYSTPTEWTCYSTLLLFMQYS